MTHQVREVLRTCPCSTQLQWCRIDPRRRKEAKNGSHEGTSKDSEKMMDAHPKLFGLILRHMSPESKDEVAQDPDYDIWSEATDPEKLWQAIVKTHKIDCVTSVDAVKELVARKAYQSIKQGPFETLAQYSKQLRETYHAYKATEKDTPQLTSRNQTKQWTSSMAWMTSSMRSSSKT
jgi:hypothetical protein